MTGDESSRDDVVAGDPAAWRGEPGRPVGTGGQPADGTDADPATARADLPTERPPSRAPLTPARREVITGMGGLIVGTTIGWSSPRPAEVIRASGSADVWPSGADDTDALQRAVDDNAVVHLASGRFRVRSVRLRSGNRVVMTPGTTIEALPLRPGDHQAVLWAADAEDLVVEGGVLDGRSGPVTLGLSLQGVQRARILGVRANGFRTDGGRKGDGFYIGSSKDRPGCTDVVIDSVTADANERQGISVIACQRLRILSSAFTNTSGDAPGAGIDIEPNTDRDVVDDLVIDGCSFTGNQHGILCYLKNAEVLTRLVVTNCTMTDNREYGFSGLLPGSQELRLDRNLVQGNGAGGVLVAAVHVASIEANTIRDNAAGRGIELHDVAMWQITGNVIEGNGSDGMLVLLDRDGSSYGTCHNNQVVDNGGDQPDPVGLRLAASAGSLEAIVTANWFRNSSPGGPQRAATRTRGTAHIAESTANRSVNQPDT